jgi:hypothetical protein
MGRLVTDRVVPRRYVKGADHTRITSQKCDLEILKFVSQSVLTLVADERPDPTNELNLTQRLGR